LGQVLASYLAKHPTSTIIGETCIETHPLNSHFHLITILYIKSEKMIISQGIKPKGKFQFWRLRFKGLPTLGIGSMQSFYIIGLKCITMWVHLKAQFFNFNESH
jgi:hypothetical protein